MTLIANEVVKCAKCGETSSQSVVYSINYGAELSGNIDDIVNRKQRCPHCNYAAADISIMENNYDINPEDNIPQRVYGVPNPDMYNIALEDNVPQKVYGPPKISNIENRNKPAIKLSIRNDNAYYIMSLKKVLNSVKLILVDGNNLKNINIPDSTADISLDDYNDFISRIEKLTEGWDNIYNGTGNIVWDLEINTDKSISYVGNGGHPKNWNEYIDLVSEYEILFKKNKIK